MVYSFRRATPVDLTGLRDALAPCYGTDARVHEALPAFWQEMSASGAMVATLSLDVTNPPAPFPVASLACLLADPALPAEVVRTTHAGVGERAVRLWMAGRRVALPAEAVAAANRDGGCDAVMLHHATFRGPASQEVLECLSASFVEFHRGVKLRSFHQSTTDPEELRWLLGAGLRRRAKEGAGPTDERPALVGVFNDELPELWGTRAGRLFAYHPPRLGLKARHRDLLEPALAGFTDEEIADVLCLSLSAVKKRWAALYEHVEQACPGVLAEPVRAAGATAVRGVERRRHLLQYVRRHPEELNPQAAL